MTRLQTDGLAPVLFFRETIFEGGGEPPGSEKTKKERTMNMTCDFEDSNRELNFRVIPGNLLDERVKWLLDLKRAGKSRDEICDIMSRADRPEEAERLAA